MTNLALDIEKVVPPSRGDGEQPPVESMFLREVNNFAREALNFLRTIGQTKEQVQQITGQEPADQQTELRDLEKNNQAYYGLVEETCKELKKTAPPHLRLEISQLQIEFAHANRMALFEKDSEARKELLEDAHKSFMEGLKEILEEMRGGQTLATQSGATEATGTASSSIAVRPRTNYQLTSVSRRTVGVHPIA